MPESFDSMLEELAEAAASATVPPGLEAVRRRAGERVVHRRMAVSALVLTLIGGSGGAWAAVSRHSSTNDAVAPMGASTAAARPSQSIGASSLTTSSIPSVAYAFGSGTEPSIWKTSAVQDGYLIVFGDGVVALSTAGSFPLCYGRLLGVGSASAVVTAGVPAAKQPLGDVACDDFGVTSGLSIAAVKNGTVLEVGVPVKGASTAYTQTYLQQQGLYTESGAASSPRMQIPSGTWKSTDGNNRTLVIGADGSVSFTAYVNTGKQYTGIGTIDAQFPTGARAVIDCANGATNGAPCGVFLILQDPQAYDGIVVYGSYGPETFIRTG
jgi:hypothetical protein